jgi:anaerobic magnesium-protoporphyrin IX monomethyl ester cyclase
VSARTGREKLDLRLERPWCQRENPGVKTDILLLVPFEPPSASVVDPLVRSSLGARFIAPLGAALSELEAHVGVRLELERYFAGQGMPRPAHRSLTAATLATHLEREGLAWEVVDPGTQELAWWRRRLARARTSPPECVALSTTFIMSAPWLQAFVSLIRSQLPAAKLIVGGYYYATDARTFLSLDADVLCVGEGEVRLPQIVSAIRDRRSLDDIPGLYLPRPDGSLAHTGHVEQLDLRTLPPVDWRLAERIEPPVDPASQPIEYGLETQRGCVFKCEFCTYRTLSSPNMLSPEEAVDRILALPATATGGINLTDATATFPHARWEEILRRLIERGGSRHAIWAYARVSDLSEPTVALMAAAGVRQVFIGQESGDQRILNAMKKGTRVDQVRPAVSALARHGIVAGFSLIHGFPGETDESVLATRRLLATLNQYSSDRPAVLYYHVFPFSLLDFASVSQGDAAGQSGHYLGYDALPFSPGRAADAMLRTFVETSRVPHAPSNMLLLGYLAPTMLSSGILLSGAGRARDFFTWLKAVERGTAMFLEQELDGVAPDREELARVRHVIVNRYPASGPASRSLTRFAGRARRAFLSGLGREWGAETEHGPGTRTRALLGGLAWAASGSPRAGLQAAMSGTFVEVSRASAPRGASAEGLAGGLVTRAIERGRHVRLRPGTEAASIVAREPLRPPAATP